MQTGLVLAAGLVLGSVNAHAASPVKLAPAAAAAAVAAPAASPPAKPVAVAKGARLGGDMQRTRFVADLSARAEPVVFLLSDPPRLIIDLPEVRFQMPAGLGTQGAGLISGFRFGLLAPGRSRIVIDLAAPATPERIALDPGSDGLSRLTLDLVRATPAAFKAKLEGSFTTAGFGPRQAAAAAEALPSAKVGPRSAKPLIVLDPGHGGIDPGAIGGDGKVYEKAVVLEFCLALKQRIEATGRASVAMTRDSDVFVPLDARTEFARARHAALFISFHADALDAKNPLLSAKTVAGTRGATVYTASEDASDDAARLLADAENRSDVLAGVEMAAKPSDDLASILVDLIRRETRTHSTVFARGLLAGLKGKMPLGAKPFRHANFRVLKAPDVPSVLVELGFLSAAEDAAALTSTEWRTGATEAVALAIDNFIAGQRAAMPN